MTHQYVKLIALIVFVSQLCICYETMSAMEEVFLSSDTETFWRDVTSEDMFLDLQQTILEYGSLQYTSPSTEVLDLAVELSKTIKDVVGNLTATARDIASIYADACIIYDSPEPTYVRDELGFSANDAYGGAEVDDTTSGITLPLDRRLADPSKGLLRAPIEPLLRNLSDSVPVDIRGYSTFTGEIMGGSRTFPRHQSPPSDGRYAPWYRAIHQKVSTIILIDSGSVYAPETLTFMRAMAATLLQSLGPSCKVGVAFFASDSESALGWELLPLSPNQEALMDFIQRGPSRNLGAMATTNGLLTVLSYFPETHKQPEEIVYTTDDAENAFASPLMRDPFNPGAAVRAFNTSYGPFLNVSSTRFMRSRGYAIYVITPSLAFTENDATLHDELGLELTHANSRIDFITPSPERLVFTDNAVLGQWNSLIDSAGDVHQTMKSVAAWLGARVIIARDKPGQLLDMTMKSTMHAGPMQALCKMQTEKDANPHSDTLVNLLLTDVITQVPPYTDPLQEAQLFATPHTDRDQTPIDWTSLRASLGTALKPLVAQNGAVFFTFASGDTLAESLFPGEPCMAISTPVYSDIPYVQKTLMGVLTTLVRLESLIHPPSTPRRMPLPGRYVLASLDGPVLYHPTARPGPGGMIHMDEAEPDLREVMLRSPLVLAGLERVDLDRSYPLSSDSAYCLWRLLPDFAGVYLILVSPIGREQVLQHTQGISESYTEDHNLVHASIWEDHPSHLVYTHPFSNQAIAEDCPLNTTELANSIHDYVYHGVGEPPCSITTELTNAMLFFTQSAENLLRLSSLDTITSVFFLHGELFVMVPRPLDPSAMHHTQSHILASLPPDPLTQHLYGLAWEGGEPQVVSAYLLHHSVVDMWAKTSFWGMVGVTVPLQHVEQELRGISEDHCPAGSICEIYYLTLDLDVIARTDYTAYLLETEGKTALNLLDHNPAIVFTLYEYGLLEIVGDCSTANSTLSYTVSLDYFDVDPSQVWSFVNTNSGYQKLISYRGGRLYASLLNGMLLQVNTVDFIEEYEPNVRALPVCPPFNTDVITQHLPVRHTDNDQFHLFALEQDFLEPSTHSGMWTPDMGFVDFCRLKLIYDGMTGEIQGYSRSFVRETFSLTYSVNYGERMMIWVVFIAAIILVLRSFILH
eukprot:gnl/Dysnectes_brevis/3795_a4881_370.p1 GENE.gnl/Dysnectes_brevis/3795_a4881_370~~gnl/Dysnectes_brevis/3795_a4881_370.p1  ORF type:complete len:1146 (+),score=391.47 gnl/Dysnectes_brevis/3795_a4881_370:50-3487(+)